MNILRTRLGLQVQRNRHSKTNIYSFVPAGEAMENIRVASRCGNIREGREKILDFLALERLLAGSKW